MIKKTKEYKRFFRKQRQSDRALALEDFISGIVHKINRIIYKLKPYVHIPDIPQPTFGFKIWYKNTFNKTYKSEKDVI